MRNRIHLVALPILVGLGVIAAEKKLGPEWTKVPDGFGGVRMSRKLDVECTRHPAGNTTNYQLAMLEKNDILASESDDGRNVEARLGSQFFKPRGDPRQQVEYAEIRITKDAAGKPQLVWLNIGNMVHWDLNADGVFDGIYDGVASQTRIVLDGRYVDVEYSKTGLESRSARSPDHKVNYVFEGTKWKTK